MMSTSITDSSDMSGSRHIVVSLTLPTLWKVIAGAATTLVAVASVAATLGMKYQENSANTKFVELKAGSEQAQAKVVALQEKVALLTETNAKWQQAYAQLSDVLTARNDQIQQLSVRIGAVNNCAFIHEQIRNLQREIDRVGSVFVLERGYDASQAENQARRASLEQRIARYQAQLGPGACN